ncbi:RagB/SusD family nutrient uptake outer membrane protein [Salinimicrobium sp. MT39]|uniref:RagB/SusD family nutrient uptake outer membrane protein n=1 Tax=Salinimicrobium profundisediminis TaxID=2994553 RepID=A0A9X3CTL9_9FLAO|nr:RagB/SusD family nutrient uptake outer membrane protein [Salinimicrobium profundisediminis]MCX2836597.1 RagB/SusD family nutrient uptake outer membrane protein [Salinimicrobium profundisediminis]
MKKIKIFLTVFITVFAINGCDEGDLELSNPSGLSPETYFRTEAQVQSAVNAVYANLQTIGLYTRTYFFAMDLMSREALGNPQLEADKRVYLEWSFDASHPPIAWYWDSCYRGINKANFVISNEEKIREIPSTLLSDEKKDKFIGEAKYLRALYYFMLVTRFGDIPLITTVPESGEGFPRSPKEQVYDLIESDLTDASQFLLDKEATENGRATQGAAFALLGKAHLYQEEYEKALAAFDNIYGEYSLEDDYFANFREEDEFGPESIFEVQFDDDLGNSAVWNSNSSGEDANEVTFRGQEYGFNDWFNAYPSPALLDAYEDGDIRFEETFYTVGDTFAGGVIEELPLERTAAWRKYQNYYKDVNEDMASGINFKVIRYADVLLMMAEAENELGDQSQAIDYINEVRERAELDPLPDGLSKEEVFDAIVQERMVELAGEQVRFPDLVRWGLAADYLGPYGFQAGKNELWPIPNDEISSNENITQADQNPGF